MLWINYYVLYVIGLLTVVTIANNLTCERCQDYCGKDFSYLRRRFTYWARHGVPGPNFIEINAFFTNNHDFGEQQVKKYGRIYGTYDFMRKNIIVNEPDLIRDILVKDSHIFPDHRYLHLGSSKARLGLFFMPGNEDWKRVRNIVSPAFTSVKLKSMMISISDISDKYVENLKEIARKGEKFDLCNYVGGFTMDVLTACAYGINIDSINNPNHPIILNAKKITSLDATPAIITAFIAPLIAEFFKMETMDINAVHYFDDLTNKIVNERTKYKPSLEINQKNKRSDFMQLMIDSIESDLELTTDDENTKIEESYDKIGLNQRNYLQKSNRTLSSDELTAQGIFFFIAGYDTTRSAITHCIYYLCQNKEYQQILYEELQTINDYSYETLNKLKYLNGVIDETLRLAPSLTRILRECVEDYKLGDTGITIPAGTSVDILPYALHRDPDFFPEPELFKPERFIKDSGEAQHHPYAYIPFGGGLRSCIGMRFALNQMRMCIAKLLNNFEFEIAPDFKIDYFAGIPMLAPKRLMVDIKTR